MGGRGARDLRGCGCRAGRAEVFAAAREAGVQDQEFGHTRERERAGADELGRGAGDDIPAGVSYQQLEGSNPQF
jgi:hypothetical protein